MLHRLERPDGPPELLTLLDVVDGPLQGPVGGPDGFGGEDGGDGVPGGGELPQSLLTVIGAEQLPFHVP